MEAKDGETIAHGKTIITVEVRAGIAIKVTILAAAIQDGSITGEEVTATRIQDGETIIISNPLAGEITRIQAGAKIKAGIQGITTTIVVGETMSIISLQVGEILLANSLQFHSKETIQQVNSIFI